MRVFASSLVVALLLGFSLPAIAQDGKKADKKPSSIVLWEEYEKTEKLTAKARANLVKAIDALKGTRKKAEKASYAELCDEVLKTVKGQRESIRRAQNTVSEAEEKDLRAMIELLRKIPSAIDKDIALGAFDGAPDIKAKMQKLAEDGKGLDIVPKETIDKGINQMFMLKRLMFSSMHIHLSTKEAAVWIVVTDRAIAPSIGQKEETKEMTEARELYLKYLDEVITETGEAASGSIVKEVSPK